MVSAFDKQATIQMGNFIINKDDGEALINIMHKHEDS